MSRAAVMGRGPGPSLPLAFVIGSSWAIVASSTATAAAAATSGEVTFHNLSLLLLYPSNAMPGAEVIFLATGSVAAKQVALDSGLNTGVELHLLDSECNTGLTIEAVTRLVHVDGIRLNAVVEGGCDNVCEQMSYLLQEWNVPLVSWGAMLDKLSDKYVFPNVARTTSPFHNIIDIVGALWRFFGWHSVGLLGTKLQDLWHFGAEAIYERAAAMGLRTNLYFLDGETRRSRSFKLNLVRKMANENRIIIICAYGGDVRDIMLIALDLGLLNGEYAFITIDVNPAAMYGRNTWMGEDGRDEDALQAFDGLLNIHLLTPESQEYSNFESEVRRRAALPPFNAPIPDDEQVDTHAGMLHDAILLYAYALADALQDGHDEYDGATVASYMFNRTFHGITGEISIDMNGDRNPDFAVQTVEGGQFFDFAQYSHRDDQFVLKPGMTVYFPGGSVDPPADHPPCGWDNEYCQKADVSAAIGAGVGTGLLFVTMIVAGALLYRKMKQEMEFNNQQLWRIRWEYLVLLKGDSEIGSRMTLDRQDDSRIRSLTKSVGTIVSSGSDCQRQVFITSAQYKGLVVALKALPDKFLSVDKFLLQELKQLISLQHDNINRLYGLCIDSPHNYIVSGYCSRGSLEDVIQNESVKLNDDFKLSFAMDICKGMEFLHSSVVGSHGRLKSSNCVVDNRWAVRVTDYGLLSMRPPSGDEEPKNTFQDYRSLLWAAPELLRMVNPPQEGTKKGDVYAFGIILQEIACRDVPFTGDEREPEEIVGLVQRGMPPFRPHVCEEQAPRRMRSLMENCWNENSEQRPQFTTVHRLLKSMNKGREINVMDNMIKMMEQYADHLEEQVGTRTRELEEEKKKTDLLLFQMLPRSVAESLKIGKYISPEAFPDATVYFSDIVGFTKIASQSSPLQVVDFLNDLYSTFDGVIDNHDVYKVETIGDAYMVVSGVPETNANRHAGAIASMSLDILSSISDFKISHMPNKQLQLRVGLHSGPVVAGVVGLKMPRYCLFGDTVNVASRMESGGLALRIHVSHQTYEILNDLGGYQLQFRGEIDIKGKGLMKTYWLNGKNDFDKPLPDVSRAAGIDEHEFK